MKWMLRGKRSVVLKLPFELRMLSEKSRRTPRRRWLGKPLRLLEVFAGVMVMTAVVVERGWQTVEPVDLRTGYVIAP